MSRIRTVKPGFFKNEELADLGPYAMLLFEGLWCHADSDGRLEDRPRRLKVEVLPYFDVDIEDLLASLYHAGFIVRYEVDGERYIWIPNFRKHQRITGKEAETPSRIPQCPLENQQSNTVECAGKQPGNIGETPETTGKEGKGKEGKGKERECAPADAHPCADPPLEVIEAEIVEDPPKEFPPDVWWDEQDNAIDHQVAAAVRRVPYFASAAIAQTDVWVVINRARKYAPDDGCDGSIREAVEAFEAYWTGNKTAPKSGWKSHLIGWMDNQKTRWEAAKRHAPKTIRSKSKAMLEGLHYGV